MIDNLSWVAIFISVVSVIIAGSTFAIHWKQSRIQQLTGESQFMRDIQNELSKIDNLFFNIKTQQDCLRYLGNFLNPLDRLCYFDSKNWLSEDIMDYFRTYLAWGLKYYHWAIEFNIIPKEDMKDMLQFIEKTCEKYNIKENPKPLPKVFQDYHKLPLN